MKKEQVNYYPLKGLDPYEVRLKKKPTKEASKYYAGSKSVSKFLGVNQGMESIGAVMGYMVLGVGVGLYTGTTLGSKVRRALIFGAGFPLSALIIGSVGDKIVTKFKSYNK
jgi:hypothetical protein